jgi:hypothetical protein
MAGLVPAIHVFLCGNNDVDARHKAGHDEETDQVVVLEPLTATPHIWPYRTGSGTVPIRAGRGA